MTTERKTYAARRSAFTLVELAMNLTIMTVLMGGIASAIVLAAHALPDENSPLQTVTQAYEIVEQMAGEVYVAVSFIERTSTAVEFIVADRNGDASPETIRYEWSGEKGEPLTRTYNGGPAQTMANNVEDFALSYITEDITVQPPSQETEVGPVILSSQDTAVQLNDFSITNMKWIGQTFTPSLPAEATAWSVTEVRFKAKSNGLKLGTTAVQLRTCSGALPSGTILEQVLMPESGLITSYQWPKFFFNNVSGLVPGSSLCLVLAAQQNDFVLADIQYDDKAGSGRVTTNNGDNSWDSDDDKSMLYYVFGAYTTTSTPPSETRPFLSLMNIGLQIGADPASKSETAVQILNRPDVSVAELS